MPKPKRKYHPVTKYLKKFDPLSTITILSAVHVYPHNGLFALRIAYLLTHASYIRPDKHRVPFTPDDIVGALNSIPADEDAFFMTQEDFVPASNLKDIPFCWKGERYSFFFGVLERPLAYLKKLADDIGIAEYAVKENFGFSLTHVLQFTLNYQKYLLEQFHAYFEINPITAEISQPDEVVIPPAEFISYWQAILPTTIDDLLQFTDQPDDILQWISLATLKNISRELLDVTDRPLGFYTFVQVGTNILAPLPQFGIEQLLEQVPLLAQQSDQAAVVTNLRSYTMNEIMLWTMRLFDEPDVILVQEAQLTVKDGDKANPLVISVLVHTDINKVILIDFVASLGNPEDTIAEFHTVIERLKQAKTLFNTGKVLLEGGGIHQRGNTRQVPTLPDAPEVITILVSNILGIGEITVSPDKVPDGIFLPLSLLSYRSLTHQCERSLDFIKFLRVWNTLQQEVEIISVFDILDAFEMYKENRSAFFRGTDKFHMVSFDPHGWSDVEYERLLEHKDLYSAMCIANIPPHVSFQSEDDGWRLFDLFTRRAWIIPHTTRNLHWVIQIIDQYSNREEFGASESLGESIIFHLNRWGDAFWEFCRNKLQITSDVLHISLVTDRIIKEHGQNPVVREWLEQNPLAPIGALTLYNRQTYQPRMIVAYHLEEVVESLVGDDNTVERILFTVILNAIGDIYNEPTSTYDAVKSYLDQHLPLGKKAISAFSFERFARLPNRVKPTDPHPADIARVGRQVAFELKRQGVQKGIYRGTDAININTNIIGNYLENLFTVIVKQYRKSDLLMKAYRTLEDIESYRRYHRQGVSAHAQSAYVTYDPIQRLIETDTTLTIYAESLSLMIEAVLKEQETGNRPVSEEEWSYLFALFVTYSRIINHDETLRAGLRDVILEVEENHKFDLPIEGEEVVDFERLQIQRTETMFPHYYREINDEDGDKPRRRLLEARPELIPLDTAFHKAFGVGLETFMAGLVTLVRHPTPSLLGEMHPLILTQEADLRKALNEAVIDITESDITAILSLITLTHEIMQDVDINARFQRERKHRLATRPLIKVIEKGQRYLVYGPYYVLRTLNLWQHYIDHGMLPLRNEDIPRTIGRALQTFRDLQNHKFEVETRAKIESLGYQVRHLTEGQLRAIIRQLPGQADSPGDIDALVALPNAKRILILDAKQLGLSTTPRQIRREVDKFFGDDRSYAYKIQRKIEFIETYTEEILNYIGWTKMGVESWEIKGGFIVDGLIASTFAKHATYPLVPLELLEEWLKEQGSHLS